MSVVSLSTGATVSMRAKKGHKRSVSSTETILKSFCKPQATDNPNLMASDFFQNHQIPNADQTKELLDAAKSKETLGDREIFIESLDPGIDLEEKETALKNDIAGRGTLGKKKNFWRCLKF